MARRALLGWLCACVGACSGGGDVPDGARPDGAEVASDFVLDAVRPPASPRSPVLTPCARGYIEETIDGLEVCLPAAQASDPPCPAGEARFLGEDACGPIGDPCPAGPFPDLSGRYGDRPLVFVLAGAAGGDGTVARPFATIGAALAAAPSSPVIVVGRGRYPENIYLTAGTALHGACVRDTIVGPTEAEASDDMAGFTAAGMGTRAANLTVSSAGLGAVQVLGEAELSLDGVRVAYRSGNGVMSPGSLVARRVVVDAARSSFTEARGISSEFGRVDLEDVLVLGARGYGIYLNAALPSSLRRVAVRDVREAAGATNRRGEGVTILNGAAAIATLSVDRVDNFALRAGFGAEVTASDVTVRSPSPGITAQFGARLTLARALLVGSNTVGFMTYGGGATLRGSDLAVVDMGVGRGGGGLAVGDGARVEASRVFLLRPRAIGVSAENGAAGWVEDLQVRAPSLSVESAVGAGVVVRGAELRLARARLSDSTSLAMALDEGASAEVADLQVVAVAAGLGGRFGQGLDVHASEVVLVRAEISGTRAVALHATGGASVAASDLFIHDTLSPPEVRDTGRGIEVSGGSTVALTRAQVERSHDLGVVLFDPRSTFDGREVLIDDTRAAGCADTVCGSDATGSAMGVFGEATARLERFHLTGGPLCGVHIDSADADLLDGVVEGFDIGVCLQREGYDLGRLEGGVRYRGNRVALDTTELPVPSIGIGAATP